MYSSVFFSEHGKGYFKANLPQNIQRCSHEFLTNWANAQVLEKGYKDFLVSENPNPIGINL